MQENNTQEQIEVLFQFQNKLLLLNQIVWEKR